MNVKMDYNYKIWNVDKNERWIYIKCNEWDSYDSDSFVYLLEKIQNDIDGNIIDMNDNIYKLENDSLDLRFQWDGCFGITVVYPENVSYIDVENFLKKYL